ncbi:MAG: WbqC family protein [Lachnospiraceae bacterium]
MKLGIMQPYFVPYIGYWQLLNAVDKYVVYDDVNFIKGGWINRNRILVSGNAQYFNLKMSGASSNKLINEVEVADDAVYMKKMLKTLEGSYKKAPYFNAVYALMEKILSNNQKNIAKFLYDHMVEICRYLDINTEIILSSEIHKNMELKAEDKILDICQRLRADEYFNTASGMKLYSKERFATNGILLNFVKSDAIVYEQFSNEFCANLSIIDVMMFNSKDEIRELLSRYTLL